MGVNLIPVVRNFDIVLKNFSSTNCAVIEQCVQSGNRKLLRFDFLSWNAGNNDASVGNPSANPQWFEFSPCHGHWHLKNFNEYRLFDQNGIVRVGNKQAFCLIDVERFEGNKPKQFNSCNSNQGITAGWADLYNKGLDCQWIDITGVPDGNYLLEAQTNAQGLLKEDRYGDNYTWAGIQLKGNTVTQIEPPFYREDSIGFNPANVKASKINNSWKVVDGSNSMLDFGNNKSNAQKAVKIIKHYKFNKQCFVGRPSKDNKQLMRYFLVNSSAPSGSFPGEDAIQFNTNNVEAKKINDHWKVVDGSHSILDFGKSEANAKKTLWIIKKYAFNHICFVGRPNPPMAYFRK
jgi:hypothetical protein